MSQLPDIAALARSLAVFEAVARHGGFRAAAAETGQDHLTIARQVRHLEARLGVKLVTRHRQRLRLTAKGLSLARAIGPGLASLAAAIESHAGTKGGRPVLRIACEPGFLGCWLMARLGKLREALPNVGLAVLPVSSALAQVDLEADMTVSFVEETAADDIVILRPAAVPVCRADVSKRHRGFPNVASLLDATLIHDDSEDYWSWWLDQNGVAVGPRLQRGKSLQVMDARLALDAARNGLGVALLNSLIAGDALESGEVVLARPETAMHETYVVRNINSSRRTEVRRIVSAIKRLARCASGN